MKFLVALEMLDLRMRVCHDDATSVSTHVQYIYIYINKREEKTRKATNDVI